MDIWDKNLVNAPQWIDFTNSPQTSDDFFERSYEGKIHYSEEITSNSEEKILVQNISLNENKFVGELEKAKMTPIKIVSPNKDDKENMLIIKETTYDEFLQKAIHDLQLNAKRSTRKTLQISTSFRDSCDEAFHTPSATMTRSTSAGKKTSSSVKQLQYESGDDTDSASTNKKTIITESVKSQQETINAKEKSNKETSRNFEEMSDTEEMKTNQEINAPSKIVSSFGNKSCMVSQGVSKKPHRVLPYQNRRLSLRKLSQPKNQKFVSIAEAVAKFQKGTPKRFHSISNKEQKQCPVAKIKQSATQLTRAVSPALRSKTRNRPVNVLSHEEREKLELEEIRKHPIKANPVRMSTLKKPDPLKKVEKKPVTIPEPFHLTEVQKAQSVQKPVKKCNESLLVKKEIKHPIIQSHTPGVNPKNKVQIVVGADDAGFKVKEVEVLHFGIPIKPTNKTKITCAVPFNFEKRTKEFQAKKEQKLKQLQEEEKKKMKTEFHAKPVPKTLNKSCASAHSGSKENVTSKTRTTPRPFSFEERDKMLLKKREELAKQTLEEKNKAHVFHANPVPNFKPILVKGKLRENLKSVKNNITDAGLQAKKKLPLKGVHVQKTIEKTTDMCDQKLTKTKAVTKKLELNTDKRAKERRQFDEKIKQKELEEEDLRRKEEEKQAARLKAENELIRKNMEIKAQPMPEFKSVTILKSDKPLTDPKSPAWSRKKH